jgi:hypothetical protein
MKIQHFMALVVLSLATGPGVRAAVRGFTARTLVPGLLTLACLLAAAPATAQVNYAVSGSTAYVAYSPNASGGVVIASTFNGYPVTFIGMLAFTNCTSLTGVTIPNSVARIGEYAFSYCPSLTSVTIPNSVTNIAYQAFYRCTSLTSVTIPSSVTSIGNHGFSLCTSLTSVTIGNSVTNIGGDAFLLCSSLTSVAIPDSVTNIGRDAFTGCTSLTNFTFLGNAPWLAGFDGRTFYNVGAGPKAHYYCGTTGWGPTYGELPTVMLFAPRIAPGSAGVKPGGFGFTLTCLTNQSIVVETSTNLVNWQPIWTNSLPGASADFVDPEWLNHSNRFYRARSD